MSRNCVPSCPIQKTIRETHVRPFQRRHSLPVKRSFGKRNPDVIVTSTEYIPKCIPEPLSPTTTRITLSPLPPVPRQRSPILQIKRMKRLPRPPDIKLSTPSGSASSPSIINSHANAGSATKDNECALTVPVHQSVASHGTSVETKDIPHREHYQTTSAEVVTNDRKTLDFLEYTNEDIDHGFQDVDLTIDPSTISISFECDKISIS